MEERSSHPQLREQPRQELSAGRRLIFVNRFFHPDHSATSQLLSDLSVQLAEIGYDVHVVTSRQLYNDPLANLPANSTLRNVRVHRVWGTRFGRRSLATRAIDYLTFYASATVGLLRLANPRCVVIAETDPPLISLPASLVSLLRRSALVNWTQDLFPEIAERLQVPAAASFGGLLRYLRNLSFHLAKMNVVLDESMAARLHCEGINDRQIAVIHNWALAESEATATPDAILSQREAWGLGSKFVIGYSGNFGRAHDFATVLDAAASVRDVPDIQFLLIGDGAQREWIDARVAALSLPNVSLQPYQPRDRLAITLAVPDVHVVSLKPELEGLVAPSKFYAILAAGRPVLFIGDPKGFVATRISQADCGRSFRIGAHDDVAAWLRQLADQPDLVVAMGRRARTLWSEEFQRKVALSKWESLIAAAVHE